MKTATQFIKLDWSGTMTGKNWTFRNSLEYTWIPTSKLPSESSEQCLLFPRSMVPFPTVVTETTMAMGQSAECAEVRIPDWNKDLGLYHKSNTYYLCATLSYSLNPYNLIHKVGVISPLLQKVIRMLLLQLVVKAVSYTNVTAVPSKI